MMRVTCVTALGCMVALSGQLAAQGLPTQRVLTLDVAQSIASEAVRRCRADGFKTTVRIVDAANDLKVFIRDDGAGLATAQIAEMKANSVMFSGRPSGPPPNMPPGTPGVIPGTITFEGGVPIMAGGQLIGAVAVSGAPGGDKDAACANAGLAKVKDQLK